MCEVTTKNFEEKLPEILENLRSATFISIDCEFSGLFNNPSVCSLFDMPNERFLKVQKSFEKFIIIQMGISTFRYERTENKFISSSYTFYIKPSEYVGSLAMECNIKSINFLARNDFDFNKLFYKGLSYLNKAHVKEAWKIINNEALVDFDTEEQVQKYCNLVSLWTLQSPSDVEIEIEIPDKNPFLIYIMHIEIRKKFKNLWTLPTETNTIRVRKISAMNNHLPFENQKVKEKIFSLMYGFTRVMHELEKIKKPIVGHNLLFDLIMIYQQFYNPDPVTYKQFKREILKLFPSIYDTKTISFGLRLLLNRENTWKSNTLKELYDYLKVGRGSTLAIFTPQVIHTNPEYVEVHKFHEAGYDSYCTGFCFMKMAHIISMWDEEKKAFQRCQMFTSTKWLIASVEDMKNHVNMTKGRVNYIVLDSRDPDSVRPGLLYVQSKTSHPLEVKKLIHGLCRYAVEIQPLSKRTGLIATANYYDRNAIQKLFSCHRTIEVTEYKYFKHTRTGRFLSGTLIFGAFVSFFVTLRYLYKKL